MLHRPSNSPSRLGQLLLLALLLAVVPGQAAESGKSAAMGKDKSVTKSYSLAQARYHGLEFSPALARDRERWLLCAKAFNRAYQLDPYHPSAPNTLFSQGDLYLRIYKQFGNKEDLNEALSLFDDVVALFPQHTLADDALYRTATIQTTETKDVKGATMTLAKVIALYPKGDMALAAEADLNRLKSSLALAQTPAPTPTPAAASAKGAEQATPPAKTATASAPVEAKVQPTEVVSLRHWSTESYTRVVIETTGPVAYKGHLLSRDEASPKRLYVDLERCAISRDLQQPIPIKDGLLQQMRSAQFNLDTVRVVLDTLAIADYKIFNLDDPFRIIVDVKGPTCTPAKAAARPSQPQARPQPQVAPGKAPVAAATAKKPATPSSAAVSPPPLCKNPSLAQQLGLGIKRVVLDPGHGGKDPGAIGVGGLREKDIVLNVAKKVARKLSTRMGIEVVLTRKSDIFIPLEERTAIANTKGGDLFISIHANAAPSAQAQGIETYYLDLAGTEAERGLAAVENASSTRQISDLQNILSSLMQNSKKDESARLAGTIQSGLISGLGKEYPSITSHGVKTAPFIVLIGAQMPSILTEIAFISNPMEAQRLQNDQYLESLADHITDGVVNYSDSLSMARL